jgi:hypothetical protein
MKKTCRKILVPLAVALALMGGAVGLYSYGYSIGWAQVAQADTPVVLLDAGPDPAAEPGVPVVILPATPASPCLDPDGPTGLQPCGPIPSVLDQPSETWTAARYYWQVGGWPFTVFVIVGVAAVAVVFLRPRDKDGDGTPDPEGAKGVAWAIAGAVLMVSVPLLGWTLKRAGVDVGAAGSGEAVAVAVVSAVGVAMGLVARALGLKMPAVR